MVPGPSLEAGHVGLTTEQPQERQGQQGREGMSDSPSLARVVNLAKCVE